MDPPDKGGPDEPGQSSQDDEAADQEHPKSNATRKGGRHRREHHRRRPTAKQVAEIIECAPAFIRCADELGKHETPIREWFHTLTGVAQQVLDVLNGWVS